MESASFLPQDARFVANPNGIDIYTIDRVQYQPRMVSPKDTVIVSKKKPKRNKLWACLIVTIIFIFLFVITYSQREVLTNGHCAGITGPKSTFLWTINAPHLNSTRYLFGTIHVPNMWNNVSSQAKNAFNNSDALALEVDLQDPEFIKKANTYFKFPNGTAIELFPNKNNIRQRIKRMAEFFQMNVGELNNPYGFNNLTNLTNEDPVLDKVLYLMAKAEGKPVISVETADEVCERLKIYLKIKNALILLDEKLENITEDYKTYQYLYSRSKISINDHMSQEEDEEDHMSQEEGEEDHMSQEEDEEDHMSQEEDEEDHMSQEEDEEDHMSQEEDEEDRLLVKTYACNILNKENFFIMEDKIRQMNAEIIEIQSSRTRNWYKRRIANQKVENYRASIKLYERLIEVMLTKRNVIMGKRIDEMLRKNPNTKYFIAFGVAHFIGKDSVQDHLINYGYTIKEAPFTDPI